LVDEPWQQLAKAHRLSGAQKGFNRRQGATYRSVRHVFAGLVPLDKKREHLLDTPLKEEVRRLIAEEAS
jgi:hypothetical protein